MHTHKKCYSAYSGCLFERRRAQKFQIDGENRMCVKLIEKDHLISVIYVQTHLKRKQP